jgi:hypothetical protein
MCQNKRGTEDGGKEKEVGGSGGRKDWMNATRNRARKWASERRNKKVVAGHASGKLSGDTGERGAAEGRAWAILSRRNILRGQVVRRRVKQGETGQGL